MGNGNDQATLPEVMAFTERKVMLAVASFDADSDEVQAAKRDGMLSCVACQEYMALRDIDRTEPSALCDGCAQTWVATFARKLSAYDAERCRPNVFLNVKETHLLIQLLKIHIKGISDKRIKWPGKIVTKLSKIWGADNWLMGGKA